MTAKLVSCLATVIYFLIVIFLIMAHKTLTPLEAGVRKNWLSKAINAEDEPYTAGRHGIGPLYQFIKYPSTLQTIEFADDAEDGPVVTVFTKGGQSAKLEVSFQYRLMLSNLIPLYSKYEQNYHSALVTTASTAIREIATQYNTTEYFVDRQAITAVMHQAVNVRLQEYFAVVEHFQLRNIDIPRETEATILNKLTKAQGVREAAAIQTGTLVRERTDLEVSRYTEEAKIEQAKAAKGASIITNQANADAISIAINATSNAYKMLKDSLEFTNDQLIRYLYLEQIRSASGSDRIAVNVDAGLFSF